MAERAGGLVCRMTDLSVDRQRTLAIPLYRPEKSLHFMI